MDPIMVLGCIPPSVGGIVMHDLFLYFAYRAQSVGGFSIGYFLTLHKLSAAVTQLLTLLESFL